MEQTLNFVRDKDCKHSVRYRCTVEKDSDGNPVVVETIYVSRFFSTPMPDKVTITIKAS